MNENQWDEKLKTFLKKTGDDLKRAGNDIKTEAEKLMKEVKDPDRQDKVKKGLASFQLWARKTAEEVAAVVETGVKKAEGAVRGAVDAPPAGTAPDGPVTAPSSQSEPASDTKVESMRHDTPVDTPAVSADPATKTIGGAKKKKASGKKAAAAKKPLGKKRTP
jgi:hypothetical protein